MSAQDVAASSEPNKTIILQLLVVPCTYTLILYDVHAFLDTSLCDGKFWQIMGDVMCLLPNKVGFGAHQHCFADFALL